MSAPTRSNNHGEISDLAQASLPSVPASTPSRGVWETMNMPLGALFFGTRTASQALQEAPRAQSKVELFEPLLTDRHRLSAQSSGPAALPSDGASVFDCVSAAARWAWRAGKLELVTRLICSGASALVPYTTCIAGAKVTDALVRLANDSQGGASMKSALAWFGASVALQVVGSIAGMIDRAASNSHQIKRQQVMLKEMRNALVGFSPAEQESPQVNQLVNRTLQSQWSLQKFGQGIFETIVPIVSGIGAITIVGAYSPVAAAGLTAFGLLYLYHARRQGQERMAADTVVAEPRNRLSQREWGFLTGPQQLELKLHQKVPQLVSHIEQERIKFDRAENQPVRNALARERWLQPLNIAMISTIGFAVLTDVFAWATNGRPAGGVSIGQWGLIVGALYSLNGAVRAATSTIGELITELPKARLALSAMKSGANSAAREEALALRGQPRWQGPPTIELENLRFSYPATDGKPSSEVLRGVNLSIKAGEFLGIVGESGSGKSTLANLLSRIHDASAGSIRFDGRSADQISRGEVWSNSGLLRQSSTNLYSMTLRENILVGAERILNDEEIMQVAERTGFAKVMAEDGLTLDTVLGQWHEGGKNLSGGQHMLLALTRGAIRENRFLLLDEPTANLDQHRAEQVLDRIRSLHNVTRIVITHDLGVARHADRILVLKDGMVEAIGGHEQLLKSCETYRELYQKQLKRLTGAT